ncbi:MAG: hypothetical protein EA381_07705 [Planctomycetaceae bacterium]|nr:MAG: hypothetical protein EA381_07705 [Planctomycetaceae bacterium]
MHYSVNQHKVRLHNFEQRTVGTDSQSVVKSMIGQLSNIPSKIITQHFQCIRNPNRISTRQRLQILYRMWFQLNSIFHDPKPISLQDMLRQKCRLGSIAGRRISVEL